MLVSKDTIFDIKTSTKGWSKWEKGDTIKHQQLYLYKNYYSELFKVPKDKINVEFYIVKRKVLDFDDENLMSPHQAYRVQNFKPVDNRKRLREAKEDFVSTRKIITDYEIALREQFSQTADAKAENKLIEWFVFNFSFICPS